MEASAETVRDDGRGAMTLPLHWPCKRRSLQLDKVCQLLSGHPGPSIVSLAYETAKVLLQTDHKLGAANMGYLVDILLNGLESFTYHLDLQRQLVQSLLNQFLQMFHGTWLFVQKVLTTNH